MKLKTTARSVLGTLMASAKRLSDLQAGSKDRLSELYGKRVGDEIESKTKIRLSEIESDGNQRTTNARPDPSGTDGSDRVFLRLARLENRRP